MTGCDEAMQIVTISQSESLQWVIVGFDGFDGWGDGEWRVVTGSDVSARSAIVSIIWI